MQPDVRPHRRLKVQRYSFSMPSPRSRCIHPSCCPFSAFRMLSAVWGYCGELALDSRQDPTQLLSCSCFPRGTGEKIGTIRVKELMNQNKNKEITNYCYRENRLGEFNLIQIFNC